MPLLECIGSFLKSDRAGVPLRVSWNYLELNQGDGDQLHCRGEPFRQALGVKRVSARMPHSWSYQRFSTGVMPRKLITSSEPKPECLLTSSSSPIR